MESVRDPMCFCFVAHLRSPRSIKTSWPEVLKVCFSRGYLGFKTVGMVGAGAASGIPRGFFLKSFACAKSCPLIRPYVVGVALGGEG